MLNKFKFVLIKTIKLLVSSKILTDFLFYDRLSYKFVKHCKLEDQISKMDFYTTTTDEH